MPSPGHRDDGDDDDDDDDDDDVCFTLSEIPFGL